MENKTGPAIPAYKMPSQPRDILVASLQPHFPTLSPAFPPPNRARRDPVVDAAARPLLQPPVSQLLPRPPRHRGILNLATIPPKHFPPCSNLIQRNKRTDLPRWTPPPPLLVPPMVRRWTHRALIPNRVDQICTLRFSVVVPFRTGPQHMRALFAGMMDCGCCREDGGRGEDGAEELLGGALQEPHRRGHDARLPRRRSRQGGAPRGD
jgi:hypothetical protein